MMAISFTVAAQTNPYPEEKENGDYARTVTFGGQKPGLGDFINTIVDEAEDEHTGSIAEIWENTGLGFYIYNTQTKKLTYSSLYDMGIEINTEGEVSGIAYILPRVGKDIKAVIYSNKGKKEVILKWNGLRFDIQQ